MFFTYGSVSGGLDSIVLNFHFLSKDDFLSSQFGWGWINSWRKTTLVKSASVWRNSIDKIPSDKVCLLSHSTGRFFHNLDYQEVENIPSKESSDRPNIRFGQTVWPNFYCEVRPKWQNCFLQNTELSFVLHSMPMAYFYIFVLLNDPHVRGVIIGL